MASILDKMRELRLKWVGNVMLQGEKELLGAILIKTICRRQGGEAPGEF